MLHLSHQEYGYIRLPLTCNHQAASFHFSLCEHNLPLCLRRSLIFAFCTLKALPECSLRLSRPHFWPSLGCSAIPSLMSEERFVFVRQVITRAGRRAASSLLDFTLTAWFNNTTTSCKNVETLSAKKGFTYFHCSQIANLSQKNI